MAGPLATVHCSNDRSWEDKGDQVDKGFFEVVGTLQTDGSIVSMTTVAMGENLGAQWLARLRPHDPNPPARPPARSLACRHMAPRASYMSYVYDIQRAS